MQERNALIEYTMLGREGRGVMTFMIGLDYGSSGQSFGGHAIGDWQNPSGFGTAAISKVLDVLGVETWEKLPGTYCRARYDNGCVYAIGHPLKNKWVDLKKLASEMVREGAA